MPERLAFVRNHHGPARGPGDAARNGETMPIRGGAQVLAELSMNAAWAGTRPGAAGTAVEARWSKITSPRRGAKETARPGRRWPGRRFPQAGPVVPRLPAAGPSGRGELAG